MKEINLTPYEAEGFPNGFEPRKFLGEALLSRILQLGGLDLLDSIKLADKIQTHEGDVLLVDENEYGRLKRVTDIPTMVGASIGFGRAEGEIVRRILEAPEVEVEKKE